MIKKARAGNTLVPSSTPNTFTVVPRVSYASIRILFALIWPYSFLVQCLICCSQCFLTWNHPILLFDRESPHPSVWPGITPSFCLTVCPMSCKLNASITDWPILMKLYTVVVYHLRMCLIEDNCSQKYIMGDNWTYLVCFTEVSFCELTVLV